MVRMTIHSGVTIIEETDVVVIEDFQIKEIKKMFPNVDVDYQLNLLSQLFRYSRKSRAETEEALFEKIGKYLKNPFLKEEELKAAFHNYVPAYKMAKLLKCFTEKK